MRDLFENEAAAVEAEAAEFFETPSSAVDALLTAGPVLPGGIWRDPCAGRGAIPRAVSRQRDDVRWYLSELRDECRADLEQLGPDGLAISDALAGDDLGWPAPSVVIFNSPFTLTVRLVEMAWAASPDAWVVSLQRQSFIGPKRAHWLSRHMPDRYTLSKRPSFRRDGGTDACEYEWHVWPPGERNRSWGRCGMLRTMEQLELFAG